MAYLKADEIYRPRQVDHDLVMVSWEDAEAVSLYHPSTVSILHLVLNLSYEVRYFFSLFYIIQPIIKIQPICCDLPLQALQHYLSLTIISMEALWLSDWNAQGPGSNTACAWDLNKKNSVRPPTRDWVPSCHQG